MAFKLFTEMLLPFIHFEANAIQICETRSRYCMAFRIDTEMLLPFIHFEANAIKRSPQAVRNAFETGPFACAGIPCACIMYKDIYTVEGLAR